MVVGDVTTAVDLLVLGAGPGGYVAALRAAQLGRHVTLVDPERPGGTCLHRGCIPLKALLASSERYWQSRQEDLAQLGIQVEHVSFDWARMQAWKQGVVERLAQGVQRLIAGRKISYIQGSGWFINEREVRVESDPGQRLKFEQCIIATGASPLPLNNQAFDGQKILTPEQALALPELPAEISIVGSDYIALELATLFARLGVRTRLFGTAEQLLPEVDPVALRLVQASLRKLGVEVILKQPPTLETEGPVVYSNGTRPRTNELHLSAAGLNCAEDGGIAVNTMQQSANSRIFAIGDCVSGGLKLASVAIKQGKVAAEVIAGQRVQYAPLAVPQIVHTSPELAYVGLSAQQAEAAGYKVITGRFPLAANGRALTLGSEAGVALTVADAEDETLLGATLVGPRAGDLIGQATLALEMGATLTDVAEIITAHPGLSEAFQESIEQALGRAIHVL